MIADEDRAVARLRHELEAVDVRSAGDHVDRVLRAVRTRRRAQRQQHMQMLTAVAVVLLAVAGAFVVMWRTPADGGVEVAAPTAVADWPLRGGLAGDADLLARAEAAWRSSDRGPSGEVRALYAGQSPNRLASFVVVALVSPAPDGRDRVAFVTTRVSTSGNPDTGKLALRAVTTLDPGQRGVGFLAARAGAGDEAIPGGGTIGFAVAAPGVDEIGVRTTMVDDQAPDPSVETGVVWPLFEYSIGAWNSGIEVAPAPGAKPMVFRLAASVDDVATEPVSITTVGGGLRVVGDDVRTGDVIATPAGVVGVVGPGKALDTGLAAIAAAGDLRTALTNVPGRIVDDRFQPTGPGELAPGNRVVLVNRARPEVSFNVATLSRGDGGWRADRVVDVATAVAVMRIGGA